MRIATLNPATRRTALFPWLTTAENVGFGLSCRGRRDDAEVRRWLQRVGLEGSGGLYPAQLSGGMRQRAALARALAMRADVLLMDEPFAALDAQTREDMQELLAELHAELGATILLVSHDIDEVVFLSDRVLVLGPSPTRVVVEVAVAAPRPRTVASRESPEAVAVRAQLRGLVRAMGRR